MPNPAIFRGGPNCQQSLKRIFGEFGSGGGGGGRRAYGLPQFLQSPAFNFSVNKQKNIIATGNSGFPTDYDKT